MGRECEDCGCRLRKFKEDDWDSRKYCKKCWGENHKYTYMYEREKSIQKTLNLVLKDFKLFT